MQLRSLSFRTLRLLAISSALGAALPTAAQTTVCGTVSGTWSPAGSPYLVACDATVPAGQSLIIEPGTEVLFFAGTDLIINGDLQAIGRAGEEIRFGPVVAGTPWGELRINGTGAAPPVSRVRYCSFEEATTAIHAYVPGQVINGTTEMIIEITDCTFAASDDASTAIRAHAQGRDASQFMTPRRRHAAIRPTIRRCHFEGAGTAIAVLAQGHCPAWCSGGNAYLEITDNLFEGSEVVLDVQQIWPAGGAGTFAGNTVVGTDHGLQMIPEIPFDIQNNLFLNNDVALASSGADTANNNVFFGNQTDCTGCAVSFGAVVWSNANGDPSDLFENQFADPAVVDLAGGDYRLTQSSIAIDAGAAAPGGPMDRHADPRPLDGNGNGVSSSDVGFDEYNRVSYQIAGAPVIGTTVNHSVDAPGAWGYLTYYATQEGAFPFGSFGVVLLGPPFVLIQAGVTPATFGTALPNRPSLVGTELFFQTFAFDPARTTASLSQRVSLIVE